MLASRNKFSAGTFHLMRLSNLSLKQNSANITSNRNNPKRVKISSLKLKKGINSSKETKMSNLIRIEISRTKKRDIQIISKMKKICPLETPKITELIVTINPIENHTTKIETITTIQTADTEINKIIKDVLANKTTRTITTKSMIIEDTQKKRIPIHKKRTNIEEEIKELTTIRIEITIKIETIIKIETMNKDQTKEITRDSIMREEPIETINKMKINQEVQKNIKGKSMKHQETNVNKRKKTNQTHL